MRFDELSPHLARIRRLVRPDGHTLQPTSQAEALYRDLDRNRGGLESLGIRFQYSTLAVRASDAPQAKGCRYCGYCLYGCAYDAIFSASAALGRMIAEGTVDYVGGVLVDRTVSTESGIRLETRMADGTRRSFQGNRAFLASGVLETARIVLNSTNRRPRELVLKQSDMFTIPLLRYRPSGGISGERLHTLCQMIVDIDDPAISSYPVQLQLYGYNDMYASILRRRFGRLVPTRLRRAIAERLFVAFGYLHSASSATLRVTREDGVEGRLRVTGREHPDSTRVCRAIATKLFRCSWRVKALPIPGQLRRDQPGAAHRWGGCFPMRVDPAPFETDRLGRMPSLRGLHIVDATILPTVPAGPLATTVMGNAYRIASECPLNNAS